MEYNELQITTNFSFLNGASHPEEFVEQADHYQYPCVAITDKNSLAGIVRAHVAARAKKIRFLPACALELINGPELLVYPTDKNAYTRLSALLTKGNLRTEKGKCELYKSDVFEYITGSKLIVAPPRSLDSKMAFEFSFETVLREYKDVFGKDLYLAATRRYNGEDQKYLYQLSELSKKMTVPLVATNDVHYHIPERRQLQDVLTCIREKRTIYNAGMLLYPNAERFLKTKQEIFRLFRQYPGAIERTQEIAEACHFSLSELKYEYPEELTSQGRTPMEELGFLAWEGAIEQFGEDIPEKIIASIQHELSFIEEMSYANYFLTVHDIVRYARSKDILCQGRGSAANSTVCFCLGITSVNPTKFDLLFERFISSARDEPPDIDVDFEHERREEVMQYIYEKYGRDRCAIVATVTQERQKGAIRDVGKAMGLSVDTINRLSASTGEFTEESLEGKRIIEQGLNPHDELLKKVFQLTQLLLGFPRQLGQHSGGFVITKGKLSDLCPILNARMENRTCIEWNKDDIDALGFLKIDVLALGMLTCLRKAFELAKINDGLDLTLSSTPQDDPAVYEMICHADTIGVFQIESRAQQSMLPRLKPRNFYDLVIEVAIVRPGPIQGDMVHPYLKRRNNEEAAEYPSKALKDILKKTLGVPLFQEQAMKIAIVAAGFTPAEADELRRSMATFKARGMVSHFKQKLIGGMVNNNYSKEYAERVFRQLEGFGSYGFPESHAASFALLVYVSAWIKWYYPDVFACALLNSMPMGFYQPAQIVIDAKKHGVEVRPVDINFSLWNNLLEEKTGPYRALRLGFRQVKGLRAEDMERLVAARTKAFQRISELYNTGLSRASLEKLADADAFRSIGLDRRKALWEVSAMQVNEGFFTGHSDNDQTEPLASLPEMTAPEQVLQDYASTSLSLKAHPVSFIRAQLKQLHVVPAADLPCISEGSSVIVAGLVLVRQRPGTAKGVCFITIEDETGIANLVVFEKLFDRYRKEILQSQLLMIEGKLQKEGEVIHVIARKCSDASKLLRKLSSMQSQTVALQTLSRADEKGPVIPSYPGANKKPHLPQSLQEELFPKGRNFK